MYSYSLALVPWTYTFGLVNYITQRSCDEFLFESVGYNYLPMPSNITSTLPCTILYRQHTLP